MSLKIGLRWDCSKDRKEQTKDKTKNRYTAKRIEDSLFDTFKTLRDELHLVQCPDHQSTGISTTFKEGTLMDIGGGDRQPAHVDYFIQGCCCEKIADEAITKFKYYKLSKI